MKRRHFIHLSAFTGAVASVSSCTAKSDRPAAAPDELKTMTQNVVPISVTERAARISKAQRLMADAKIEALVLDAGTSMKYFTGISWHPSERPMIAIIPAKGKVQYICPGFEESRLRELATIGNDFYVWQEDEPLCTDRKGI